MIGERDRDHPLFRLATDMSEWFEFEVAARGFDNSNDEMNALANFLSTYLIKHYDDPLDAVRAVSAGAEKVIKFNLGVQ